MAIAERELKQPKVLTYEDYLTEGETPGRYEIIDGVREYMTSPHTYHEDIAQNIFLAFRSFCRRTKNGRAYVTAIDIVTQVSPLKVRQADVFLISNLRWGDRGRNTPMPLDAAPELVVEVLSPSETKTSILAKMREYSKIGVLECWLARPNTKTVEVWTLAADAEPKMVAVYSPGEVIVSPTFPGLTVDVNAAFDDSQ